MLDVFFLTSKGQKVSVFDATDAEFDAFIQQYTPYSTVVRNIGIRANG
jgi:hypothetical protein